MAATTPLVRRPPRRAGRSSVLDLKAAQTSCGDAVPIYELKEERLTLRKWVEKKGDEGVREYRQSNNQVSIDGLPTYLSEEGATLQTGRD